MADSVAQPPLSRRTAHEFVRETLRRLILNGSLAGGTRLYQVDVARRLRVSTTPVREAFRDLATDGLIELDAHRGATVRRIDGKDLQDIYDIRLLLEPEAMRRLTPGISSERLDHATGLIAAMDRERDPTRWALVNHSFHEHLIEAATSERMRAMIRSLQDSAAAYVIRALKSHIDMRTHNDQHRQIVAALRDRDGARTAEEVAVHLRDTLAGLMQLAEQDRGRPEPSPSELAVINDEA